MKGGESRSSQIRFNTISEYYRNLLYHSRLHSQANIRELNRIRKFTRELLRKYYNLNENIEEHKNWLNNLNDNDRILYLDHIIYQDPLPSNVQAPLQIMTYQALGPPNIFQQIPLSLDIPHSHRSRHTGITVPPLIRQARGNKYKNSKKNYKKKKSKIPSRSTRKAKGTGEDFRVIKSILTNQLPRQHNILPEEAELIARHYSASILQKHSRKYIYTKRQLRQRFEDFNLDTGEDYDPMDPDLIPLVIKASQLLKRQDYQNPFWRKIIGLIFIGLHESEYYRRPKPENYIIIENAFKKILNNVMNYDATIHPNYFEDDYLYRELVEYVLGHND